MGAGLGGFVAPDSCWYIFGGSDCAIDSFVGCTLADCRLEFVVAVDEYVDCEVAEFVNCKVGVFVGTT